MRPPACPGFGWDLLVDRCPPSWTEGKIRGKAFRLCPPHGAAEAAAVARRSGQNSDALAAPANRFRATVGQLSSVAPAPIRRRLPVRDRCGRLACPPGSAAIA